MLIIRLTAYTQEVGDGSGSNVPVGAIDGIFSVSADQQVYFSKGNLQYQASTNIWKFADNQYDYVGNNNRNISSTYAGWIDLFGWGTSGYNHGAYCYQPWSKSTKRPDYNAYGHSNYNLNDQTGQADWGYNPISNGGNTANQWRTLTIAEWEYVFNTRATATGIRYAKANVNNINGVILLPDNWNRSTYSLKNTNSDGASYSDNTLTDSQWGTLEQAGAVFLPAAGKRYDTSVSSAGSDGIYWSASYFVNCTAHNIYFYDIGLGTDGGSDLCNGRSVRLVSVVEVTTAEVSDNTTNSATCGGAMTDGDDNVPTGAINGKFSVSAGQQVYFSKGNLQYQASTNIWKFADNQYDYVGYNNSNISSTYSGWIDLFCWGTSGNNHGAKCYQPWSDSFSYSDYFAYGDSKYNLNDQTGQADWGYNPISNGGNTANQWRTLTSEEWQYVFNNRTTASGIRYAKANVNNINGVILLPDDWDNSIYNLNNTNSSDASFNSNTIAGSQWSAFEQAGAVFLPAAGNRNETSVGSDGYGYYWSASHKSSVDSYNVCFYDSSLSINSGFRGCGRSVRLVCDAN